jgi:hypothetical protein
MAYSLTNRETVVEPVPGLACSLGGVPLLSFYLIGEAVPDTGNGEDKAPVFGNRFDLLPQLCHEDVQAVCAFVRACTPELFEEVLARENLTAMGDENLSTCFTVNNSDIILTSAREKLPTWGAWDILKATWLSRSRCLKEGTHVSTRGTIYDQRNVSQRGLDQRDCPSDGPRSQNHPAGRQCA